MRIILLPSPSSVIFCGFAVKAGSRNELPGEEGLAHFCEHLSFKGTHRRTAVQIINALEGVGGELNAFTNKEDTVYYAATTSEHFRQAVDVLADIVFCSEYPQHEVEKESEVVCDEIESYEDSPAELIFDEFENLLFAGHPLGHNILGTSERVRQYTSADAHRFTSRYYQPDNCIFFASGKLELSKVVRLVERAITASEKASSSVVAPSVQLDQLPASPVVSHRNTHQSHVMMGARAFHADDPRRWALYLLNNMLGDAGAWSVYFASDSHDVQRCCRLVRRELQRLMQSPLSELQLNRAKQQLRGQLTIAADNREQFTLDNARNFLHRHTEKSLTDLLAHIDALTAHELQNVACTVFDDKRMLTLIYD